MSFDLYKKRMMGNGGDIVSERVKDSRIFISQNFKDDPSYKSAILHKLDLSQESVDIRIKNVDRTTREKRFLFLPDTKIEVGSFIEYDGKYYLNMEFQDENVISPYSVAKSCNQFLNWKGLDKPIPCYCDNSSYGTKGVIDTTLITTTDGKILFFTQYNKETARIVQDMRFIFDNNKYSVYKVVDVNRVVTGNVLRLVMDKTDYQEGKDDLVNNVAYNKWLDDQSEIAPPMDDYRVKSYTNSMVVNKYTENTFTVVDEDGVDAIGDWTISIDLNGSPNEVVKIIEKGSNYIKLYNNGYMGYEIMLKFAKDDIVLTQMVKVVR